MTERKNNNKYINSLYSSEMGVFFLLLFLIFEFAHNGVMIYLELTQFSIKN